jgi:hypothetical protein
MAAPSGNQFWKLRSKHGRDTLFATPELMWDAACEYFQWCIDNPFYKHEAKVVSIGDYQSDVRIVEIPVMRPFTMQGLCQYLGCNTRYFSDFKKTCGEDFSTVITRIEDVIYNQKFSGAASGFFNSNIIARDLGLRDKQEIDQTINIPAPIIILDNSEQED